MTGLPTSLEFLPSAAALNRQRTIQRAENRMSSQFWHISPVAHFDSGDGVALDDVCVDIGDIILHDVLVDPVERVQ